MPLPKRFPDRDEVAAVRAEADALEPERGGATTTRRLAGRVHGAPRHGQADVPRPRRPQRPDPAARPARRARRRRSRPRRHVGVEGVPTKSRRGEPSLAVRSLELLAKIRAPLPDTFHGITDVEQRYRRRYLDLLMNEESRACDPRAHAHRRGDPCLPRRRGLPRGRDADPPASLRRRLRRAVRHALERARPGPLPAYRGRALPQAPDRRRPREGLRALEGLPQREHLVQALARSSRRSSGTRRTPTTATRWSAPRRSSSAPRSARSGTTKSTFRGHEVDLAKPWRRVKFVEALERAGRLVARCRRAAREARTRRASTRRATRRGSQLARPRVLALRRAGADPADDRLRLADRDVAVRADDGRRRDDRRALRVRRRRDGVCERVQRAERQRGAGGALRDAGRRALRPATSRRSRATPTSSRHCPTACRRRAAAASASTASRWCSRAATRSATSSSSRRCGSRTESASDARRNRR